MNLEHVLKVVLELPEGRALVADLVEQSGALNAPTGDLYAAGRAAYGILLVRTVLQYPSLVEPFNLAREEKAARDEVRRRREHETRRRTNG